MTSFAYLASPYQNPDDPTDRAYCDQRFAEVCAAAAVLMERGDIIFCPIAHSHPIAGHLDPSLRASHGFWLKQDFALLDAADRLIVLMLHQWDRSYGVAQEINYAKANGIPIFYVDPGSLA
jgi:nucleoside 2-deoxyribosyltransferase